MVKLNIKTKLFLLVITVLIPLITLQIFRINTEFNEKIQKELETNEEFAQAIATSFTNYIEELWIQEDLIGSYFTLHPDLSFAEKQTYLLEAQSKQETLLELTWINPNTVVLASSTPLLVGKSLAQREYLQRILNGEEKVISNLEFSLLNNDPLIVVARAIKKDGKLVGIMAGIINVNKLYQRLPQSDTTLETTFGLIDKNGMIVYRNNTMDITSYNRKIPANSPSWKALEGEIVRTTNKDSWLDNSKRIGVDYPINKIGWDCFVTTSYEKVMTKHYERLKNDIFILIIVCIFSSISALWLSNKLLRPLYQLKEAVAAIKAGDFSVRTNIHGYDELAITAEAFDNMVGSIEKYDKAKSQFFTNLSHELKTPINVILASAQLMDKTQSTCSSSNSSNVYKQIKIIKQNCYRLIRMISNLIDVSKYESGYLPIKLGNYNIVSIVEDITMSVVRFAEMKEIEVLFDTDIEEKIIACDPDIIERIILNLLSNSLKFTDKNGNITVSIFDKLDKIVISVKDTGIGIPKDKIDIIFNRFGQVDSSLSRNHEGSGIGLSLIKTLVEAHNGTIEVLSELGEGTEMIIKIPVVILPEVESSIIGDISANNNHDLIERVTIEFSDIYEIRDIE